MMVILLEYKNKFGGKIKIITIVYQIDRLKKEEVEHISAR